MPEYLSPGVYVEEIDAGPKPIEAVSTSTAGAVGVTERGPTDGRPELVTSFSEFTRRFGGYMPDPPPAVSNAWAADAGEGGRWWQFALAVKGFFDNGGQRLYVKRVFAAGTAANPGAVAARVRLGRGLISEVVQDAPATATTLRVRHLFDVQVGTNVTLFVNGASAGGFTVTAYDGTGTLTLNNPVGQAVDAGRDFLEIHAPAAVPAGTGTLVVRAAALGQWGGNEDPAAPDGILQGNGLSVSVRPMVGATLTILPDAALGGPTAETELSVDATGGAGQIDVNETANFVVGDRVAIGGATFEVTASGGGGAGQLGVNPVVPGAANQPAWPVGTAVRRLRPANDATTPAPTLSVRNASQLYPGALVELDNGTLKEGATVVAVSGNRVTFSVNLANAYHEDQRVRVIEAEVGVRYRRRHRIEPGEERFTNLRLVDDGTVRYIVTHINERSKLIRMEVAGGPFGPGSMAEFPSLPAPIPASVNPVRASWWYLTGGQDNLDQLTVDDFVGVDGGSGNRTGILALEDIDEIAVCLAPGVWAATVHNALINHCEMLKDRFAILDPQDGLDVEGIRQVRERYDTKYAALYYPWVTVRDPLAGRDVDVGPSGHMCGVYARVDVERGVHKAPANEVVRGITRIADDVTKREQDVLNPRNINVLRAFPNRGNRVWGARVLTSDSAWKYVSVRRLFIMIEESLDEGLQWVVFEPNDEGTWARVRQTISNFLQTQWRNGALFGATADEAFFVRCDRSTMTEDDILNGRLIVEVGVAPVRPAEFVIVRIQQKTIEAQQA